MPYEPGAIFFPSAMVHDETVPLPKAAPSFSTSFRTKLSKNINFATAACEFTKQLITSLDDQPFLDSETREKADSKISPFQRSIKNIEDTIQEWTHAIRHLEDEARHPVEKAYQLEYLSTRLRHYCDSREPEEEDAERLPLSILIDDCNYFLEQLQIHTENFPSAKATTAASRSESITGEVDQIRQRKNDGAQDVPPTQKKPPPAIDIPRYLLTVSSPQLPANSSVRDAELPQQKRPVSRSQNIHTVLTKKIPAPKPEEKTPTVTTPVPTPTRIASGDVRSYPTLFPNQNSRPGSPISPESAELGQHAILPPCQLIDDPMKEIREKEIIQSDESVEEEEKAEEKSGDEEQADFEGLATPSESDLARNSRETQQQSAYGHTAMSRHSLSDSGAFFEHFLSPTVSTRSPAVNKPTQSPAQCTITRSRSSPPHPITHQSMERTGPFLPSAHSPFHNTMQTREAEKSSSSPCVMGQGAKKKKGKGRNCESRDRKSTGNREESIPGITTADLHIDKAASDPPSFYHQAESRGTARCYSSSTLSTLLAGRESEHRKRISATHLLENGQEDLPLVLPYEAEITLPPDDDSDQERNGSIQSPSSLLRFPSTTEKRGEKDAVVTKSSTPFHREWHEPNGDTSGDLPALPDSSSSAISSSRLLAGMTVADNGMDLPPGQKEDRIVSSFSNDAQSFTTRSLSERRKIIAQDGPFVTSVNRATSLLFPANSIVERDTAPSVFSPPHLPSTSHPMNGPVAPTVMSTFYRKRSVEGTTTEWREDDTARDQLDTRCEEVKVEAKETLGSIISDHLLVNIANAIRGALTIIQRVKGIESSLDNPQEHSDHELQSMRSFRTVINTAVAKWEATIGSLPESDRRIELLLFDQFFYHHLRVEDDIGLHALESFFNEMDQCVEKLTEIVEKAECCATRRAASLPLILGGGFLPTPLDQWRRAASVIPTMCEEYPVDGSSRPAERSFTSIDTADSAAYGDDDGRLIEDDGSPMMTSKLAERFHHTLSVAINSAASIGRFTESIREQIEQHPAVPLSSEQLSHARLFSTSLKELLASIRITISQWRQEIGSLGEEMDRGNEIKSMNSFLEEQLQLLQNRDQQVPVEPSLDQFIAKMENYLHELRNHTENPQCDTSRAQLPKFSLFQQIRADFFGPIHIRLSKETTGEAYIILFTCLSAQSVIPKLVATTGSSDFVDSFEQFIEDMDYVEGLWTDDDSAPDTSILLPHQADSVRRTDPVGKIKKETEHYIRIRWRCKWHHNDPEESRPLYRSGKLLAGRVKRYLRETIGKVIITTDEINRFIRHVGTTVACRPVSPEFIEFPSRQSGTSEWQKSAMAHGIEKLCEDFGSNSEKANIPAMMYAGINWCIFLRFWRLWNEDLLNHCKNKYVERKRSGRCISGTAFVGQIVIIQESSLIIGRICKIKKGEESTFTVTVFAETGTYSDYTIDQLAPVKLGSEELTNFDDIEDTLDVMSGDVEEMERRDLRNGPRYISFVEHLLRDDSAPNTPTESSLQRILSCRCGVAVKATMLMCCLPTTITPFREARRPLVTTWISEPMLQEPEPEMVLAQSAHSSPLLRMLNTGYEWITSFGRRVMPNCSTLSGKLMIPPLHLSWTTFSFGFFSILFLLARLRRPSSARVIRDKRTIEDTENNRSILPSLPVANVGSAPRTSPLLRNLCVFLMPIPTPTIRDEDESETDRDGGSVPCVQFYSEEERGSRRHQCRIVKDQTEEGKEEENECEERSQPIRATHGNRTISATQSEVPHPPCLSLTQAEMPEMSSNSSTPVALSRVPSAGKRKSILEPDFEEMYRIDDDLIQFLETQDKIEGEDELESQIRLSPGSPKPCRPFDARHGHLSGGGKPRNCSTPETKGKCDSANKDPYFTHESKESDKLPDADSSSSLASRQSRMDMSTHGPQLFRNHHPP